MVTEPKIDQRPEQAYLSIRTQVTMGEMGSGIIPQLHNEVMAWMNGQGIAPSGAPFIRYNVIDMADKMDIELGWPVTKAVAGNGRVTGGALPAGRYASVVYTGDYSGLMDANRVLIEWAKDSGIVWDRWDDPNGDAFRSRYESYWTDPGNEPDPAKWETEVAIKLADA